MRRVWWRVVLPVLAGGMAVAPLPAGLVEQVYAAGLFPLVQPVVTTVSNLAPFALLDVMLVAAAACLAWRTVVRLREPGVSRVRRATRLSIEVLVGGALVYLAFLAFWGLNYRREPAETRFGVDQGRVSTGHLLALATHATDRINELHDADRPAAGMEQEELLAELAPAFARAMTELPAAWHPTPGRPKASLIARLFPLAGIDGMMNPWGLEVLVNPELLPFERPFVVAHEWAHLAGNAGESEASFVGWLTCLHAGRGAQYSGWLGVYLHILRTLPPEQRIESLERLAAGPRRDVDAIRQRLLQALPSVQSVSWGLYDRYLRANRVESGIANYDEVVVLVLGSRFAAKYQPVPP